MQLCIILYKCLSTHDSNDKMITNIIPDIDPFLNFVPYVMPYLALQ